MTDDRDGDEPRIERIDDDLLAVDTMTGGMSRITAGHLIAAPRPVLIECGPSRSVGHVIAGLRELGLDRDDLAYVVVTHIHLDHAGGAGDVAAAFPNATIVVSEVGARHLADPERLNASAHQVYGDLFESVYGPCTPIDAGRIRGVADGDTLDLGGGRRLQLLYTPGHAKHHIAAFDADTGTLFSGDSVGVRIDGMQRIRPATPPADFNLDTAKRSIRRYRELAPERLFLAHYGPVDPPEQGLDEAVERLDLWAAVAEEAYREEPEVEHVAAMLRQRFTDEIAPEVLDSDPEAAERLEVLSGVDSNAAGLVRYFSRRDEGTLTELG